MHALLDFLTAAMAGPWRYAVALAAAVLGGLLGGLSARVGDAVSTVDDDALVLPHVFRALRDGTAPRGRWLAYAALGGLSALILPWLAAFDGYQLAVLSLFSLLAIPASALDAKLSVIPDEATWVLLFSGLLFGFMPDGLSDAVLGAAVACAALWATMTAVGYRMGENTRAGGDVAAAAAGGAWVGLTGAGAYLFYACAVYLVYAGIGRALGNRWVPFGPALFSAVLVSYALRHLHLDALPDYL